MSVIVAKIPFLVTVAIPKLLFLYKKPWHFSVLVEIMLTFIHHDVNNMPWHLFRNRGWTFFSFPPCLAPSTLPFGRGSDTPTRRIREGLATVPVSVSVPPFPSAQSGVPLGMARWTSLWLMGMVSARYCVPQGPCLPVLFLTAVLAAVPTSSSMPGSQLKLLVGTSIT